MKQEYTAPNVVLEALKNRRAFVACVGFVISQTNVLFRHLSGE